MFKEFKGYFGNSVFVKVEDVVAVKADVQQNKVRDDLTIIYTNGNHQFQVRGNVNEVLKSLVRK